MNDRLLRQDMDGDPVYKEYNGWFFVDETWSNPSGPYETEAEARKALADYCKNELGETGLEI